MSELIIVEKKYYPVLVKNRGWIAVGNVAEAWRRTKEGNYLFHLDIYSPAETTRHFFSSQKELREDFAYNCLLRGRKELRTAGGTKPKFSQDFFSLKEPDYELLMQGKGVLEYDEGLPVLVCGGEVPHSAFKKLPQGWRRLGVLVSADDAVAALSLGQQEGSINQFYYSLSVSCRGMVRLNWATLPKTEFYWMPDGSVFEWSNTDKDWQHWVGVVADPVRAREIAKRSEDAFAPEERIW